MVTDPQYAGYSSYIMSAYVKYIEAQGARVVPITTSESIEQIKDKLEHLDGVLFPGGGCSNYDLGKIVWNEVLEYNKAGKFYPMWGTCMGYENMVMYTADLGKQAIDSFDLHKVSLPIKFLKKPESTKMFKSMGKEAYDLQTGNYTYNSHLHAVKPDLFTQDNGLKSFWDLTSVSFMPNGTAFVATIESKEFPIYGTQFHPEKPSELWTDGLNINHSWHSIELHEHFSKLFVELAR